MFRLGSQGRQALARIDRSWKATEHVLVTGGTGSGKTVLAYYLDMMRVNHGGHVVNFVAKIAPDETITDLYRDWTRWESWPRRAPTAFENKILLWPKVEGLPIAQARHLLAVTFADALDTITAKGKWTVHIDEGLFMSLPYDRRSRRGAGLGLGDTLATMSALYRSSGGTLITLSQRPSHLPLALYANASHSFIARASESADLKRLAELGGRQSARELQKEIANNGDHDFLWVPTGHGTIAERLNLAK
jgi:energy-coupling factor transporter ATP-binding protein EcfA2